MGRKKISEKEFDNRIKCIFNNKYKRVGKFTSISDKTEMLCEDHGIFYILPRNMLYKQEGCKLCGIEKMSKTKSLTKQEFVEKAKKIFGDKYDYSLSNYINYQYKINIICKKCGNIFSISPNNHLKGKGCKCYYFSKII